MRTALTVLLVIGLFGLATPAVGTAAACQPESCPPDPVFDPVEELACAALAKVKIYCIPPY